MCRDWNGIKTYKLNKLFEFEFVFKSSFDIGLFSVDVGLLRIQTKGEQDVTQIVQFNMFKNSSYMRLTCDCLE